MHDCVLSLSLSFSHGAHDCRALVRRPASGSAISKTWQTERVCARVPPHGYGPCGERAGGERLPFILRHPLKGAVRVVLSLSRWRMAFTHKYTLRERKDFIHGDPLRCPR